MVRSAMTLKLDARSLRKVQAVVNRVKTNYPKKVRRKLYQFSETRIIKPAKEDTPVDEGTLRGTGHSELAPNPKKLRVEMGFGGPAADYAIDQHENFTYKHEVGGPKFLEKNFVKAGAELPTYIINQCPLDDKDR